MPRQGRAAPTGARLLARGGGARGTRLRTAADNGKRRVIKAVSILQSWPLGCGARPASRGAGRFPSGQSAIFFGDEAVWGLRTFLKGQLRSLWNLF